MRNNTLFNHFIHLFIPLIISNSLHMVVVKKDAFSFLKIPLSTPLFGVNKTWRGFFFVIFMNALFYSVCTHLSFDQFLIGGMLGFSYMLFELPNSYLKRRAGIMPGEASSRKLFTFVMDKSDSALGVTLCYCLLMRLSTTDFLVLFLSAFSIHTLCSLLLVKVRIKEKF